jgi:hypothetical protein
MASFTILEPMSTADVIDRAVQYLWLGNGIVGLLATQCFEKGVV